MKFYCASDLRIEFSLLTWNLKTSNLEVRLNYLFIVSSQTVQLNLLNWVSLFWQVIFSGTK